MGLPIRVPGLSAGTHTPFPLSVCPHLRSWPWSRSNARFYQAEPAPVAGTAKYPVSLCLMLVLPPSERLTSPPRTLLPVPSSYEHIRQSLPGSPLLQLLAWFEESLQVATSPCCQRDFPDVIPESLSCDAWASATTVCRLLLPVTSSASSAFPNDEWVGLPFLSTKATSQRATFRRL